MAKKFKIRFLENFFPKKQGIRDRIFCFKVFSQIGENSPHKKKKKKKPHLWISINKLNLICGTTFLSFPEQSVIGFVQFPRTCTRICADPQNLHPRAGPLTVALHPSYTLFSLSLFRPSLHHPTLLQFPMFHAIIGWYSSKAFGSL